MYSSSISNFYESRDFSGNRMGAIEIVHTTMINFGEIHLTYVSPENEAEGKWEDVPTRGGFPPFLRCSYHNSGLNIGNQLIV